MSSKTVSQRLPSSQQLLNWILEDYGNNFRDVSLIVEGKQLQKATSLIDLKLIKRVITIPDSIKSGKNEAIRFCLPDHCNCSQFASNLSANKSICEHMLAIALLKHMKIEVPTKKVNLVDVVELL
ncbi:hypothetical protein JH06_0175 [Blastocystis sp. subtype 4]|uniref:hypothetical protein n=1 Tax=Blastocystis sp. subtype 4 TaxID=944170 RepID=UPI00071186B7|nr:hypothetical protein JH06_0175 [Blastocystis sp. subtype 4]KNB46393.1 hypothetical protein JH06_0175 [Blastocystis sp. subtype 4]|eukprot:XP_014529836.1 hypothetical protein JH06_0175 [Blastocystis sp. subtype 4]